MKDFLVDADSESFIMTVKQVAAYLQISPRSVYSRWKELGGLRVGRTIRLRKEVLDALFRPEEKNVERGGEEKEQEICKPKIIQDKDRSKILGEGQKGRTEESGSREDPNRHGLTNSLQQLS